MMMHSKKWQEENIPTKEGMLLQKQSEFLQYFLKKDHPLSNACNSNNFMYILAI